MTQLEILPRERTVEVSPEALARVCPEQGLNVPPERARGWAAIRCRLRLAWIRVRFRLGTLQPLKCHLVRVRLRARLIWMKLRYRKKLGRRRTSD